MPQDRLFTLEKDRWYAWHMLPGYVGDFLPHSSPIFVQEIKLPKTGRSELELAFFNASYAQGVRDFRKRLRIHIRRSHHLLAAEIDGETQLGLAGRDVVIGQMSFNWLKLFLPDWYAEQPNSMGTPDDPLEAEKYLSIRFFGGEYLRR